MPAPYIQIGLMLGLLVVSPDRFLFGDEPVYSMDPYFVTVSRFSEEASSVPANVTVIDIDDQQSIASASVVDILEKNAGLFFRSTTGNGNQAEVDLRGFGENSGLRVLVMLDGQKLNRPDMGGIDWMQIPMADVVKIEVIKGGQTTIYGDQAMAGVIKITTKNADGDTKPGGFIDISGGSYGQQDFRGSFKLSPGKTKISVFGERHRGDGFRHKSKYVTSTAGGRVSLALTDRLNSKFNFVKQSQFTEFPGPLTKRQFEEDPRQSNAILSESHNDITSGSGLLSLNSRGHVKWKSEFGFKNRDLEWSMDGVYAGNQLKSLNLAPRFEYDATTFKAVAGLDIIQDNLNFERFFDRARSVLWQNAELTRESLGLYANGRWKNTQTGRVLTAGIRGEKTRIKGKNNVLIGFGSSFEAAKSETGVALNLGLTSPFSGSGRYWIRFDRIYRYPVMDEIAAYQGFPLSSPFNEKLKPESGYGYEMGVEVSNGRAQLNLNGFAQYLDGEIAYDYVANLNRNLTDTRRTGIESRLIWKFEKWSLRGNFTYLEAEHQSGPYEGREVYLVPRLRYGVHFEWNPIPSLDLQAGYRYSGSSYEGNDFLNTRPKLAAYGVADLTLNWRMNGNASIQMTLDNLFDKHYATIKYSGLYYPAALRRVRMGIRYRF